MNDDLISRSAYKNKLVAVLDILEMELFDAIVNEDMEMITSVRDQQNAYKVAMRILDDEPIAYDVDKVMNWLEKELEFAEKDKKECIRKNSLSQFDTAKGYATAISNAIEVVKKGGEE